MKILHILDHSIPLHSGYTFRSRSILEHQQKLGWMTFHVTSTKQGKTKSLIETIDGFTFYRTPQSSNFLYSLPVINQWGVVETLVKRLETIVNEVKPDILHAHSPALNGLAAIRVGKKLSIPVVYECRAFWEDAAVDHGTTHENSLRYKITRSLETYVFKNADKVTTICEGLRSDIIKRGVHEDKITVIPNAVNIEKFEFKKTCDIELKNSLGLADKVVLGFIGSFYAYEGLPLLLDAMQGILQSNENVKLLLVGGGPQEQLIKEKVEQLGFQDIVVFTGRVPHEEVQEYYNLVDIFVYPRLSMRLTDLVTPLKPLEAMAQGRIVVASDVGGHKELIKEGYNGSLFEANNPQALAESVIQLLSDSSVFETLQYNGRQFVEHERNWKVSVDRYKEVYGALA